MRQHFLRLYPQGFEDPRYLDQSRSRIVKAHVLWSDALSRGWMEELVQTHQFFELASRALEIERTTNLLLPFERSSLEHAIQTNDGAEIFARALQKYLHAVEMTSNSFEQFVRALALLPRKHSRVVTWPIQTVFSFIADPARHLLVNPRAVHSATEQFGFVMTWRNYPQWRTFRSVLDFAAAVREDLAPTAKPRDMIDLYFFLQALAAC